MKITQIIIGEGRYGIFGLGDDGKVYHLEEQMTEGSDGKMRFNGTFAWVPIRMAEENINLP